MRWTRRSCLAALSSLAAKGIAPAAQVASKSQRTRLSMPGLYRGKVVAVEHPGSIVSGKYQAEPVRQMIEKGMTELTGAPWAEASRQFVQPGDVVGLKVNPVGQPHVISDATVLRTVINGLTSAGVKPKDIVVYDRYRRQFLKAGFDKWLPEGVRYSNATEDYDTVQHDIAGYDPDHYLDLPLTLPGYDIANLTARRSYAAKFITREVNKLINLPVLKDHQSAGVTLALKNLSHGLVNNVCRSHSTYSLNACGQFIPAVVSMPVIRDKVVLHILDGIKGLYHGGPGAKPEFVWEHRTMYFATDPVALDHVGWQVIDRKRVAAGMKLLVDDKPDQFSHFVHRQPEHIEIAGAMGLGEFDLSRIQLRKLSLA